jgi:3-hydroxyisobutyrate dehydrogenase-like beta-hydroxyacid dehydrogenase
VTTNEPRDEESDEVSEAATPAARTATTRQNALTAGDSVTVYPGRNMSTVAVIGLGGMGIRMAGRLLDAGHELVVWNRTPGKAEPLVGLGAVAAESPADAARRAEAVITMVADPEALRQVTEGSDGVAAGASEATTVIQMSTVSPAGTARLQAVLEPTGAGLLDSPVLGSLSEVEAGTLRVFAGGEEGLVERWTSLLSVLGTVIRVGPLGAGTAAKLVANSTLLGVLGVLGEALLVARKLGLSQDVTFEVLAATPVAAQAERRRPALASGEFPQRFALSLALKDAGLILEAAGAELKVIAAVRDWLAEAQDASWGDRDYSALLAYLLRD